MQVRLGVLNQYESCFGTGKQCGDHWKHIHYPESGIGRTKLFSQEFPGSEGKSCVDDIHRGVLLEIEPYTRTDFSDPSFNLCFQCSGSSTRMDSLLAIDGCIVERKYVVNRIFAGRAQLAMLTNGIIRHGIGYTRPCSFSLQVVEVIGKETALKTISSAKIRHHVCVRPSVRKGPFTTLPIAER